MRDKDEIIRDAETAWGILFSIWIEERKQFAIARLIQDALEQAGPDAAPLLERVRQFTKKGERRQRP